jgi:sec-independent protein translocase protein TatA
MHTFSIGELALIFGIVVILFGSSRLAKIGKSLGEGIANFKKGLKEADSDIENDFNKCNNTQKLITDTEKINIVLNSNRID